MPVLRFDGVSKTYTGPQNALSDISFSVDAGEMLFDALGGDLLCEDWIVFRFERDQTDVRGVAFVARAGVGDLSELDFHSRYFTGKVWLLPVR